MAVYKRGGVYWFNFVLDGEHIQESSNERSRKKAKEAEEDCKTRLRAEHKEREAMARRFSCSPTQLRACSDCGNFFNATNPLMSSDGKQLFCSEACQTKWESRENPTPTFLAYSAIFERKMRTDHQAKPKTVSYYINGLKQLRSFFGDYRLDRVTEREITRFIEKRQTMKKRNGKSLTVATVNRELEVLRRLLRVAHEDKEINRVPKISRLPGEVQRERVLDHAEEQTYLAVAKQPLRDVAMLILDGGFRPEEVFRMRWDNLNFRPAGKALYGYVHVPDGKTKYANRNVSMTQRVKALLEMRHDEQGQPSEGWVFPGPTKSGHIESLKSQHRAALEACGVKPFVLYSLRHTMLTRLGEAGVDAFAIQKIAGHSSILISQRYVHPTPERIEGAFTSLENYNVQKLKEAEQERQKEICVQ